MFEQPLKRHALRIIEHVAAVRDLNPWHVFLAKDGDEQRGAGVRQADDLRCDGRFGDLIASRYHPVVISLRALLEGVDVVLPKIVILMKHRVFRMRES